MTRNSFVLSRAGLLLSISTLNYEYMSLSVTEVQHLAQLARLQLTADEVDRYAKQLSEVLGYVEQLKNVAVVGETKMRAAAELRTDVAQSYNDVDRLVAAAPEHDERYVVVPPVFEEPH